MARAKIKRAPKTPPAPLPDPVEDLPDPVEDLLQEEGQEEDEALDIEPAKAAMAEALAAIPAPESAPRSLFAIDENTFGPEAQLAMYKQRIVELEEGWKADAAQRDRFAVDLQEFARKADETLNDAEARHTDDQTTIDKLRLELALLRETFEKLGRSKVFVLTRTRQPGVPVQPKVFVLASSVIAATTIADQAGVLPMDQIADIRIHVDEVLIG